MDQVHNTKKANTVLKILGLLLIILASVSSLTACSTKKEESKEVTSKESSSETTSSEAASGDNLVIPVSELSAEPSFYPVTVGDTDMEIIAVKDDDGSVRTAFNTCQVCYSSGRGYYKVVDDKLICQNCGNQFSFNQIGIKSGGCNPWPVFDEDKTVDDTSVTISYEYLNDSVGIFSNWKTF